MLPASFEYDDAQPDGSSSYLVIGRGYLVSIDATVAAAVPVAMST